MSRLDTMRGDVPGAGWPPMFTARTGPLAALALGLERSQWLDAHAIAAGQRRQLVTLARHHATHSPWFAARLAATGLTPDDLGQPGALQRLPTIDRREAQAVFAVQPVTALPPGHGPTRKVNTSGSSGEPVIVWKTVVNQLHWLAMTLRWYLWREPDFSRRLAIIRANLSRFGERPNWGAPMSMFFETGPLLRIDVEADIARQATLMTAFGAQSAIIYPSNLSALIDHGLPPTLKRVRTLGETLSPEIRARAGEAGLDIADCYSTEEAGYVAIECPEGGLYHVMAETLIVEIVDEAGAPVKAGEAGQVAVTDLHNHATPLVRYLVGDIAEAGPACPCRRGLPTLRRILGRERNMIVKPDGSRHWPLTGYKQFREIAPVIQYQFVQHARDRVEVRLVTERALTAEEETNLAEHIRWKLRHPFAVEFAYFEGRLPLGPNGKFEEFRSMLDHA